MPKSTDRMLLPRSMSRGLENLLVKMWKLQSFQESAQFYLSRQRITVVTWLFLGCKTRRKEAPPVRKGKQAFGYHWCAHLHGSCGRQKRSHTKGENDYWHAQRRSTGGRPAQSV